MTSGRYTALRLSLFCACAALLGAAQPARAAEGASFNPIGFSGDGRYFAFEQYGIQDPSGFPYWDVFVVDTVGKDPVANSPASAVVEDETRRVVDAHLKVNNAAEALLKANGITDPFTVLAANPGTQLVPDRRAATFERWYTSGGADPKLLAFANLRYELRVDDAPVPKPGNCDPTAGPYPGMKLRIRDLAKQDWQTLYADAALPPARGCVRSYDLAAVVAQTGVPDTDHLIAIVGVYAMGFGGEDHRYIAVPFMLPK